MLGHSKAFKGNVYGCQSIDMRADNTFRIQTLCSFMYHN